MFKMWKQVKELWKEEKGATVVEVSFLIPLLLFLIGGIFLFSVSFLDIAATKGREIMIAQQLPEKETEPLSGLFLLKCDGIKVKKQRNEVIVEARIRGKLPWEGLRDYMQTEYESYLVTSHVADNRKQWMWSIGAWNNGKE